MDRYQKVLERIESTRRFGNHPGVEVTAHMLEVLGHPESGLPYIHIAGTNGKGSTCAFLNRILQNAGLKVGCFTSPHLIDFCERITVNDVQIEKEEVIKIGEYLLSQVYSLSPTMFDYCLLMAMLYFKKKNCDVLIIETGLGGRLDSTNALGKPLVSVITRIGYDHMAILGDSLKDIAKEKAGIIKAGIPVVIAPQEEEAMAVLKETSKGHPLHIVSEEDMDKIKNYDPGMNAKYQEENAALAESVIHMLKEQTNLLADIDEQNLQDCVKDGIHEAFWPGRMELLSKEPFFMVDGAHNSNGVRALKCSLEKLYPDEKFVFIMGVMADKDYEEMVRILLPVADSFVTVTVESERALTANALAEFVGSQGVVAGQLDDLKDISGILSKDKKTIAMGSLYFIGDIRKSFIEEKGYSMYN